jgi:hypothetical protein
MRKFCWNSTGTDLFFLVVVVVWIVYSTFNSSMFISYKDGPIYVYTLPEWEFKKGVMGEGQERWSEWVVNMGVVGVWIFFS